MQRLLTVEDEEILRWIEVLLDFHFQKPTRSLQNAIKENLDDMKEG